MMVKRQEKSSWVSLDDYQAVGKHCAAGEPIRRLLVGRAIDSDRLPDSAVAWR